MREAYGNELIADLQKRIEDTKSEIKALEELKLIEERREKAYNFVTSINDLKWDDVESLFDFTDAAKYERTFNAFRQMQQGAYSDAAAGFGPSKTPQQTGGKSYGQELARRTIRGRK
ncbi:hypothetical protein [Macrococcoides canis]|uniref:hypothetical protein n=1 Tax=Macrococcoides canis TaxID=1855823 RepID=UPI00165E809D|nr:hypothetical protein [Macrococcus canis]